MFKNIIDILSKPVVWYLKAKKLNHVNIIINTDEVFIQERNFDEEIAELEKYERMRKILDDSIKRIKSTR